MKRVTMSLMVLFCASCSALYRPGEMLGEAIAEQVHTEVAAYMFFEKNQRWPNDLRDMSSVFGASTNVFKTNIYSSIRFVPFTPESVFVIYTFAPPLTGVQTNLLTFQHTCVVPNKASERDD